MRKVTFLRGYSNFAGANHLEVEETTGTAQEKNGTKKVVALKKAIIAAGSQAVRLPFMPNDPRVVDSNGALALNAKRFDNIMLKTKTVSARPATPA